MGTPITPAERTCYYARAMAALRAELGEATCETAWAEGRAMSLDQAVAYVLADHADDRAVGEP